MISFTRKILPAARGSLCTALRKSISNGTQPLYYPGAYDDEGKTTVHVMNKDEEYGLMIDGYSQVGFKLNNNMTVLGPMIIFPRSVLAWNIEGMKDVNQDSLALFKILEPKVDIIVLGTGDQRNSNNIYQELIKFSREHRIAFEILPTESACSTFNFLNAEGRNVVGAMIPPETIRATEDDEVRSNLRYGTPMQGTGDID